MIAYFISHPIQYFSPLFKRLADKTMFEVYYYSDCSIRGEIDKGFGERVKWDVPLLEGYHSEILKNSSWRKSMDCRFFDAINFAIPAKVYTSKAPVIILNGWSYFSDWLVLITAFILRKEVWMRIETPYHHEERKRGVKQKMKALFLRHFIFKFLVKKFLYIGTQNKLFYEKYGVSPDRLVFTPYSVDNEKFRESFLHLLPLKQTLKKSIGIPVDSKVICFCGKYILQKRPLDLLNAFVALKDPDLYLIMVGEGNLRDEMQEFIKRHQLKSVLLTGFVNQGKIAEFYTIADLFVMTSGMGETWGLAVNEAMNFNLPVIISETCGSSYDLVKEGENGFVYKEGDIQDLTKKIQFCLQNKEFQARAGKVSAQIINEFSINRIVENITQAYASEYAE